MRDGKGRCYRFGNVRIDCENLRLTVDSEVRPLEPKSFRLLLFLVENPGRALPKDEIMAAVWPDAFVSDNSLARAITQVRKAVDDDPKSPRYIETVPTIGYRFVADCSEEPPLRPTPFKTAPWLLRPLPIALLCLLAIVVVIGVWRFAAKPESPQPLRVVSAAKLTSYPGDEREPAISPDGSTVAFSWAGASGDNYDIYLVKPGAPQPLRLTRDLAPDSFPAWSPDGSQIAFVRRRGQTSEILVVPPLGGTERVLHRFARIGSDLAFTEHPLLAWTPDGQSIIYSGQSDAGEHYRLFLLSVQTGAVRPISTPDPNSSGDSSPAVSADGKFLAFVRYLAPVNGHLLVQPMGQGMVPQGSPIEVKSPGQAPHSPVWLDHGKHLLFADSTQIIEWDRDHGAIPIYAADGALGGLSLGPETAGARQIVVAIDKHDQDIWIEPLNATGTKSIGPPQELLRSTSYENHPDYSPDGRRIVFASGRSGTAEIWVADADGGNPRQLTQLGAHVASYPKWSPDGTRIAFHARVPDTAEVYIVDPNQGTPTQFTHADPGLALATWSRNGKFIYASTLLGGKGTTYRIPLDGGSVQPLWEGALVQESVDGKYVLYWKSAAPGIFRRSLAGDLAKNPEEMLVPDFWPLNQLGGYAPVAGGIYYVSSNAEGKPGPFRYFDYATRRSIDIAPAVPGLGKGFAVAPDHRHIAFAANTEIGGDLLTLNTR